MFQNSYHNPILSTVRNLSKKIGLLKKVKSLISKRQEFYEEAFHAALKGAIIPGDTVWDIGANVGIYTNYFF